MRGVLRGVLIGALKVMLTGVSIVVLIGISHLCIRRLLTNRTPIHIRRRRPCMLGKVDHRLLEGLRTSTKTGADGEDA